MSVKFAKKWVDMIEGAPEKQDNGWYAYTKSGYICRATDSTTCFGKTKEDLYKAIKTIEFVGEGKIYVNPPSQEEIDEAERKADVDRAIHTIEDALVRYNNGEMLGSKDIKNLQLFRKIRDGIEGWKYVHLLKSYKSALIDSARKTRAMNMPKKVDVYKEVVEEKVTPVPKEDEWVVLFTWKTANGRKCEIRRKASDVPSFSFSDVKSKYVKLMESIGYGVDSEDSGTSIESMLDVVKNYLSLYYKKGSEQYNMYGSNKSKWYGDTGMLKRFIERYA